MGGLLHDPVADARDVQVPNPTGGLGNVHPARWRRMIRSLLQFAPEIGEEDRDAPFLNSFKGLAVDSRSRVSFSTSATDGRRARSAWKVLLWTRAARRASMWVCERTLGLTSQKRV